MSSFDELAASYDVDFTQTQIGQYLRQRVHERLLTHFQAGDHVLELGCGTGEDALFLAQQGIAVTATDTSAAMLQQATRKTVAYNNVRVRQLDLTALPNSDFEQQHSGAFSNFGALNCLGNWRPLAAWLAQRVQTNGVIGLGIMAPYCLWELAWHSLHLDFDTALRRVRGTSFNGVPITYPRLQRIERDFAPYFRRVHIMPLGLFLPPSDAFGVIEKRPRLHRRLLMLESRFGQSARFAMFADHYWIELQRTHKHPRNI